MKTRKKLTTKRLDGKKKLIAFTQEMWDDMRQYCRDKNIESESEFVRQAIVRFIDSEYDDNTLKLSGLKDIREQIALLHDMVSVLFSYQHMMHLNILAYHPEIAEELKAAAFSSAGLRHDKFFASFRDRLRDDPAFFERLLHGYVTGSLDE
jgi:Arc/MetJ-type ribon-helix-helix transcriptional regulator